MDKIELLKEYLDLECHNLFCYSVNYAMTSPKPGYEKEWNKTKEKIALIESMINE